jgi:hypothetical protein
MSEYEHYEWQTVDRLLTEAEQEAVSRLSSHIEVSSSRAVVTYSWGDFKHDPRQVLARFFDAHLYVANWGSRRLMFRFPTGLVSPDAINAYCVQDRITFNTINGFDILDMEPLRPTSVRWWHNSPARRATSSCAGWRRATQPPEWNSGSACFL